MKMIKVTIVNDHFKSADYLILFNHIVFATLKVTLCKMVAHFRTLFWYLFSPNRPIIRAVKAKRSLKFSETFSPFCFERESPLKVSK